MALTINTNESSLIARRNLEAATSLLNRSILRMTTGYKLNNAFDNAANFSIAKSMEAKISSLDVASNNASIASDLLVTLEDTCSLLFGHLQRIRDLTEQAANGVYGSASKAAIESEVLARLNEIDRISDTCEFNGVKLMNGDVADDTIIQVGIDSSLSSQIILKSSLFEDTDVKELFAGAGATVADVAKNCANKNNVTPASKMLEHIDEAIKRVSNRVLAAGAARNSIDSAVEAIDVRYQNLTSSLSTIRDTDVAEESSNYIKAQILQQAAATLLSTANQTPQIALNLL